MVSPDEAWLQCDSTPVKKREGGVGGGVPFEATELDLSPAGPEAAALEALLHLTLSASKAPKRRLGPRAGSTPGPKARDCAASDSLGALVEAAAREDAKENMGEGDDGPARRALDTIKRVALSPKRQPSAKALAGTHKAEPPVARKRPATVSFLPKQRAASSSSSGPQGPTPRRTRSVVDATTVSRAMSMVKKDPPQRRASETVVARKKSLVISSGNKKKTKTKKSLDGEAVLTTTTTTTTTPRRSTTRGVSASLMRGTASSSKKRQSAMGAEEDTNDHVFFETCLGNSTTTDRRGPTATKTKRAPRTTGQNVPIRLENGVVKVAGGGASVSAAERKLAQQRIETLKAKLKDQQTALTKAQEDIIELAMNGARPGLVQEAVLSLEALEAKLRKATERCFAGDETAEADCEKWGRLVEKHPEKVARDLEERRRWEEENAAANAAALDRTRRVVPANVATGASKAELVVRGLPEAVAHRVMTERALWLVRLPLARVAKTVVTDLRKYNTTTLDLIELRAVYAALPATFDADTYGAKATWREEVRARLVALAARADADAADGNNDTSSSSLDPAKRRHPVYAEVPSDADLTLDPPFDPKPVCDDGEAGVAAPTTSAAEARDTELDALMQARREAALETQTAAEEEGDAAAAAAASSRPKLRPPPKKIARDDPRAALVAAITARPRPNFLATIEANNNNNNNGEDSGADAKEKSPGPPRPAFLAELFSKRQQPKASSPSSQKQAPAFLAELFAKQQPSSQQQAPSFLAELAARRATHDDEPVATDADAPPPTPATPPQAPAGTSSFESPSPEQPILLRTPS